MEELMIEYRVLSGASAKSLEEQVVDLMSEGYQLQGGVSVAYASGESSLRGGGIISAPLFSQAMLKDGPDRTAAADKPDRDEWIMKRLNDEYRQYWNEEQQLYVITEQLKGEEVEVWKPTRDELIEDVGRAYDDEFSE